VEIQVDNNISLQLFRKEHTKPLFECIKNNEYHLSEWRRWLKKLNTLNMTQKFIEKNARNYENFVTASSDQQQHPGFQLGILGNETDNILGMIGYQGIHLINRICSIGYWVDEKQQGKGIITNSCKALIKYSFETLNFNRIEIQCTVENSRSKAVPERLNFTKEAILAEFEWKEDKKVYVDHVLYRMLRSDYYN